MTRLNMRGLLALVLTVLTLGLGQVPASAQVIGRVPYLSSNPCKGVTLSLAFARSTGSNCLNGQRYGSVTNIPGWTYSGGASGGSYAAKADGSLQLFANNTPRITDAGYWAEEARTNSIRNNSMVGAVVGTPGTAPTNWLLTAGAGLSWAVAGTGVDGGANYVDLRLYGTSSGTQSSTVRFDAITAATASSGQVWSISSWLKLSGGSLSNISTTALVGGTSTNGTTISATFGVLTVSLDSNLTRYTISGTAGASVTNAVGYYQFTSAAGAVDVTVRVMQPQLELGSFATSPIPTTSVAVTRAADVGSVTVSPGVNQTTVASYTQLPSALSDGVFRFFPVAVGSYIGATGANNTNTGWYANGVSGVGASSNGNNTIAVATSAGGNFTASRNGGSPVTSASSDYTGSATRVDVGVRGATTVPLSGPIRRIVIYPRAFGNAELQAATIGPVSFANDNAPEEMTAALWGWVA